MQVSHSTYNGKRERLRIVQRDLKHIKNHRLTAQAIGRTRREVDYWRAGQYCPNPDSFSRVMALAWLLKIYGNGGAK